MGREQRQTPDGDRQYPWSRRSLVWDGHAAEAPLGEGLRDRGNDRGHALSWGTRSFGWQPGTRVSRVKSQIRRSSPAPAPGNVFELEGNEVRFVEVGHSDTDKSSVICVPSIGLVVAGDVVYNGYHQYLAESGNGGLEARKGCAGYRGGPETDACRGEPQEQGLQGRSESDTGNTTVPGGRRSCHRQQSRRAGSFTTP